MTRRLEHRVALWSRFRGLAAIVILFSTAAPSFAQEEESARARIQEALRNAAERRGDRDRSLVDWARELAHPSTTRREAATRELIQLGDKADQKVRRLLQWGDPMVALRARRIFEAIHGANPEDVEVVESTLSAVRQDRLAPEDAANRLVEQGPVAWRCARRLLLDRGQSDEATQHLLARLTVFDALERLERGDNHGDSAYEDVLALGALAAPALLDELSQTRDRRTRRVHALWLYSQLSTEERVAGLAPFVRDSDPVIRREALLAAIEAVDAEDFAVLAEAAGDTFGPERELLAGAVARRLNESDLEKYLEKTDAATASLAASALGLRRSDKAVDHLAKRLGRERRSSVREAMVMALGEHLNDKARRKLTEVYSEDEHASVRSAALSALRGSWDDKSARVCVRAGLFDDALEVRLLATDILSTVGDETAAPALVYALGADDDTSVRRRALAVLQDLIPSGPTVSLVEQGAAWGEAGALDRAANEWRSWLRRREDGEEPSAWWQAGVDAERIVRSVREDVQERFFYFDKPELVEEGRLNQQAIVGLTQLLERKESGLKVEGLDRRLLERMIRTGRGKDPAELLAAIGSLELDAASSDMVRLTNAAAGSLVRSLGDRFSRMIVSNDPEGKVIPDWLPGLLDGSDKTNGLMIGQKGESWEIEFILFDTPAYWQGLRVGDQVLKVGGDFVSELESDEIRKRIGDEVKVSILREGWDRPYEFQLVPVILARRTVSATVLPGDIGYLRLKQFEAGCSVKIEQSLRGLEKQGIVGLILDLRNNPGGTVIDAVEIVDKFLPAGKVITITETIGQQEREEMMSKKASSDRDYPLVVLVNRSSASASEMTSGSLQGNERAVVIGETSYGKGIGQSATAIAGFAGESALGDTRSQYMIYLTMMRYYLPPGRTSIHLVGVEPDIPVKEALLKRTLMERIQRVRGSKRFERYLSDLVENQRDLAVQLVIEDKKDTTRYPDFADLMGKLRTDLSEDHVRRTIRRELRRRLVELVDDETFEKISLDLEEDRVLQRAVEEIAKRVGRDLSEIAQDDK